jgi:hypothetical protein
MGMPKGISGNPAGRPAGIENKITTKFKGLVNLIIEDNLKSFNEDLKSLEPKDRLNIIVKLMEFVLPKSHKIEGELTTMPNIMFINVSETYNSLLEDQTPEAEDQDNSGRAGSE